MAFSWSRQIGRATTILLLAGSLGACASSGGGFGGGGGGGFGNWFGGGVDTPPPEPALAPEVPASIRRDEVVGRWGYAAFHKPEDRTRTETAARGQCRNPYVINSGPNGGVIMHLADEAQPQELRLKGSQNGKNYIGPPGPPGSEKDREIVSFDGRVMLTRFIDPDASTRYGTSVYVRCAPRA